MNKKSILLLLVLVTDLSFAQISQWKFFISFTDKNNSPYSVSNPSAYLSLRALQRRANQNIVINQQDLPVNPQYVDSLVAIGATAFNRSKWMNGVTISVPDSATLNSVMSFPFVQGVTQVKRLAGGVNKNKFEKIPAVSPPAARIIAPDQTLSYSYGVSFNQIHLMNGEFLHDEGFRGEGMVIALLDAGFYHANQLPAFDSLNADNRILGTWNFVANNDSVFEGAYHGMEVLSCIAGNVPDSLVGTAPEASFYLLLSEDVGTEYLVEEYNWASAAELADSAGADLISSSLGYTEFDPLIVGTDTLVNPANHTYADMDGNTAPSSIAADIAASKGMLVLVSAGNQGQNAWHYISAPSDADSVLSVAAVEATGFHAGFSSYGPASDGDRKPNVAAQGAATVIQLWYELIGPYGWGTSYACPVLAGSAACLWQAHPSKTNMEILHAIEESANYASSPNDSLGFGIPNFEIAHQFLSSVGESLPFGNSLIVYPNPVRDDIRFLVHSQKQEMVTAILYDELGKEIYVEKYFNDGIHSHKLNNTQNLNSGIYLLKVISDQLLLTKVLIKI